jgi:hypothetical protein
MDKKEKEIIMRTRRVRTFEPTRKKNNSRKLKSNYDKKPGTMII